jgi:hypothetical protein
VKSISSLGKIITLGYASYDNSSSLGGKVALYPNIQNLVALDTQITTVNFKGENSHFR